MTRELTVLETSRQSSPFEAQQEAATRRIAESADERRRNLEVLEQPGGIAKADDAARVAARLDRLSRYWSRAALPTRREEAPPGSPEEIAEAALERGMAWGEQPRGPSLEAAGAVLEAIVGTPDFVGVNYLESGVRAARAVGRVNVIEGDRLKGYGTGSLVAPHVLLSNHHVLPTAATARGSLIEFDFEDAPDGQLRRSCHFPLDPDALFIADEALDFALVAVAPGSPALTEYGFNPLIEAEGKAIVGEFVTIVQHPRGERKQVALRDNRIVAVRDEMLHYEADTERGSSGSLVFNDQWEAVALHHMGIKGGAAGPGGVVNEGVRVSRIIGRLREAAAAAPNPLLGPVLDPGSNRPAAVVAAPSEAASPSTNGAASIEAAAASVDGGAPEKIEIDSDYSNRKGYDADFLGGGKRSVPLPGLSEELAALAAVRTDAEDGDYVLPYHHFSLVMNKERKLAIFTAVNVDGATAQRIRRDPDRWSFDPRLPVEVQTGEAVYRDNDLDRGHLVRRLDPAWGKDGDAKAANDDTFHFTNCSPQHSDFNQNATTWAGLEDYILDHADNEEFKVSVFSGPVYSDDDPTYRGVKLPRQFWKVAVMAKSPGLLSATAYLLSQASLVEGMKEAAPVEEEFSFGAFGTFQVSVKEVEGLTGLDFGSLADFDPLGAQEATMAQPRRVVHESAVIL